MMQLRPQAGLWVVLTVLAVNLLFMPAVFMAGDPLAWREEARSLVRSGTLKVDVAHAKAFGEPGQYFIVNRNTGEYFSKFGVANGLLAVPAVLAERIVTGAVPAVGDHGRVLIWNLYYIALSGLTAWVLMRLAARYTDRPWLQSAFVLACLFGGFLWYYQRAQSQELYQVLLFSGFFLCLTHYLQQVIDSRADRRAVLALLGAWAMLGLLTLTRISFAVALIAPFLATAWVWRRQPLARPTLLRHALPLMILPAGAIVTAIAAVNWIKTGSSLQTGYDQWRPEYTTLTTGLLDGLAGFVFSMRWSVFVYFPMLALALPGWPRFFRRRPVEAIVALSAFVPVLLVVCSIPTWRGEWTFGPRYLIFALPVLALPALVWIDRRLRRRPAGLNWALAAMAIPLLLAARSTFHANRFDFFAVYHIASPLEAPMNLDAYRYLNDHVEGTILRDLAAHEQALDQSELFRHVSKSFSPPEMDGYRKYVAAILAERNFYWFR